jgi:hypothetical protein
LLTSALPSVQVDRAKKKSKPSNTWDFSVNVPIDGPGFKLMTDLLIQVHSKQNTRP